MRELAGEIWGDLDGVQRNKHYYGKGLVVWGLPPEQVAEAVNLPKDAEFAGPLDSNVVWIHRRVGETDITSSSTGPIARRISLRGYRAGGKEAELWHPDSGQIEPAGYAIAGGRTTVPLHLAERESVFVVFRRSTKTPTGSCLARYARSSPLWAGHGK